MAHSMGAKTYGKSSLMLGHFDTRITNLLNLVSEMRNNNRVAGNGAQES